MIVGILIVIGFAVNKNPELLSGSKTLSKEKNSDLEKLTTTAKNSLFITGVCVILVSVLLTAFKIKEPTQLYTICAVVLFCVIYITVKSNQLKTK